MKYIDSAQSNGLSNSAFSVANFPMRSAVFVHGLAVVSNDGFIARLQSDVPKNWASPEDFAFLQSQLSSGGVCVMGRVTHKLFPNIRERKRVVFSRSIGVPSLSQADPKTLFINPHRIAPSRLLQLCENHLQHEGTGLPRIFVLGGTSIYDFFLRKVGYDQFDLTRESTTTFGRGVPLFLGIAPQAISNTMVMSGMSLQHPVPLNSSGLERLSFIRPKLSETENASP